MEKQGWFTRFNHAIRRYFITGLLVIIPLWGTYLILKTLFMALDGVIGNLLRDNIPYYVPGLGAVVLLLLVLLVGVLATNFLGRKVLALWEALLSRLPFIRKIYSLVKSIVETVSVQGKQQFNRVVLIQFPQQGQYCIAFVTGPGSQEISQATAQKVCNVYVPTTPNPTSGYLLMVPEEEVIPLAVSVEEGMKMIISGGFYNPTEPSAPSGPDKPA